MASGYLYFGVYFSVAGNTTQFCRPTRGTFIKCDVCAAYFHCLQQYFKYFSGMDYAGQNFTLGWLMACTPVVFGTDVLFVLSSQPFVAVTAAMV